MKFSDSISKQILERGISLEEVEKQLLLLKTGTLSTKLVSPATFENGILCFSEDTKTRLINEYERQQQHLELVKFVPASGSASRMFKFLFHFLNNFDPNSDSLNAYVNHYNSKDISLFLVGLEKFPFYHKVLDSLSNNYPDFDLFKDSKKLYYFALEILSETGLNYANQPKGLVPFHKYKNDILSSAFEEHLFEAVLYASSQDSTKVHFTISEDFKGAFTDEFNRIKHKVEVITKSVIEIFFSYQMKETETIAVTPNNTPFIENDTLLFRPAGHGALINNLNNLNADIVFIKNIDNVVVYKYKHQVARYKKILAGSLLELRSKVYEYQELMESATISKEQRAEVISFMNDKLNICFPDGFSNYKTSYKNTYIANLLNRPLRVCGMVKNEGEPGGGPFWVVNSKSEISLQIVETAQIDLKNVSQRAIFNSSTHFNPVDIVCSVKNYKGEKYNLLHFVDSSASFISSKTKDGIPLKTIERPGLWNGAMADWNTVFVEVPLTTFNPVKTVNDLLNPAHQVKF